MHEFLLLSLLHHQKDNPAIRATDANGKLALATHGTGSAFERPFRLCAIFNVDRGPSSR